jgi:hypothetical protein
MVTALGLVAVLVGAVAWLRDQPYGVYYPLLLGGALGAGIFGAMLGSLERRYAEVELRRMRAADTR